ncbi:tol-pal system YbgF family protein [Kitasatospora sp. NPDC127059]|uniref:tetratricopeptide repeat protein n=1 Tax=unclassified Kitasatospora TaxID=2633591 RepID=UPI0036492341
MVPDRAPNVRLRELLQEAQWTGAQLARAVNRIGAESGVHDLAYQRASVHQWLVGASPRGPVAHLVCAALSRRLGRRISLVDAGFGGRRAQEPPTDVRALLAGLAAASRRPDRNDELIVYQEPASGDPAGPVPLPFGDAGGQAGLILQIDGGRVEAAPEVLTMLLPVFSVVDRLKGGGYARTALAAFLSTPVAAMVSAPAPPVRRTATLAAASRLSYLCAFMHLDDGLNGLAGHYYRLGLDLAHQAGDVAARVMILRAMAAQAYELNHPQESLRLARAAVDLRVNPAAARLRASVLGQLALAEAATGDREAALRHVRDAYDLLSDIEGPAPPVGDYHRASWDHQRAMVQAEFGDLAGAIRHLKTSAAGRPRSEARSRALVLGKLAERQLAAGRLDAACETWHEFLDVYPLLSSWRAQAATVRMRRLLLPFRRRPTADHLLQRAAALRRL